MTARAHSAPSWAGRKVRANACTSSAKRENMLMRASGDGCSSTVEAHLFVRVFGVDRGLWLVGPDSLVERFQQGALQQRQSPLHFTSAESQRFLTLRNISEAKGAQLLHLRTPEMVEIKRCVTPGQRAARLPSADVTNLNFILEIMLRRFYRRNNSLHQFHCYLFKQSAKMAFVN